MRKIIFLILFLVVFDSRQAFAYGSCTDPIYAYPQCGVCVQAGGFPPDFASFCQIPPSVVGTACQTQGIVTQCTVMGGGGNTYLTNPCIALAIGYRNYCAVVDWFEGGVEFIDNYHILYMVAPSDGSAYSGSCSPPIPVCVWPQVLDSFTCLCGCSNYSDDVCRVKPDSASTCNYDCPSGASIGDDGHCYKNGVRCRESFCPDECNVTSPTCTAGDCELSCNIGCPSGYIFDVVACLCEMQGEDLERYESGVHAGEKKWSMKGQGYFGKGGYEKRY